VSPRHPPGRKASGRPRDPVRSLAKSYQRVVEDSAEVWRSTWPVVEQKSTQRLREVARRWEGRWTTMVAVTNLGF